MKDLLPRFLLACVWLIGSPLASRAQPFDFQTLAGSAGSSGSSDGTNSGARFNSPFGLAVGAGGAVVLADGNAIRMASPLGTNWIVTTLAGVAGSHGPNDGTNTEARFDYPQSVAVDALGNIFVADTYNNAIRKVTPFGTNWVVTTIAGLSGRLNSGTNDGSNDVARFSDPYGLALGAGGILYVADTGNRTIRKVTPVGTNWVVTTIAGLAGVSGDSDGTNSVARFGAPSALAVDGGEVVYVTDFASNTIRRIIAVGTNWAVTTFAGLAGASGAADGLTNAARFNQPQGIAVDSLANLYVTDSGNQTVRRVTPLGLVTTVAGLAGAIGIADGLGPLARFNVPYGAATDRSGLLYVTDNGNFTLRRGRNAAVVQLTLAGRQPVLSWPLGLTGFLPQVSTISAHPSWASLATNGLAVSGGSFILTSSIPSASTYYRLAKPVP